MPDRSFSARCRFAVMLVLGITFAVASPATAAPTNIVGATNATPIVITTNAPHGLASGEQVTITGVTGNTAANGTWVAVVVDATRFILDFSAGNGAYLGGGTWSTDNGAVASLVVTKTADTNDGLCDADCSLREAITVAHFDPGGETITFAIPTSDPGYDSAQDRYTLALTLGELFVRSGGKVTIQGLGAKRLVISGSNQHRHFSVSIGTLTIDGVTLRDGKADTCPGRPEGGECGGAILNSFGVVNIVNSHITLNQATDGGGIFTDRGDGVNILNSTISANQATNGGAIYMTQGPVSIANTTVSGNVGGGIYNVAGTVTVSSSTVVSNGDTAFILQGLEQGPTIRAGQLVMANTIVANHVDDCVLVGPTSINIENNLTDHDSCDIGSRPGVTNLDLDLKDNGGPTPTHALLAGSNAIDAVPSALCTYFDWSNGINPLFANGAPLASDQRGVLRPRGAACDVGAVERNLAPSVTPDNYTTTGNTPLTVAAPGVLGNDADADGDQLQASVVSGPSHGTLALNANGSFTYTPANGFNGADAFTYKASDGTASANAVANITVGSPTCGIDVTPATIATPYLAIPYLQGLGTNSSGRYTFSVTAGSLPPGVYLASVLGVSGLIGIPQTPGTYTFTITATKSGANCRASRTYTVTVPRTVVPLLTCVQKINKNTYRGTFGYDNSTGVLQTIAVGGNNYFTPGQANRGQVATFAPGVVTNAFTVNFTVDRDDSNIAVWLLRGTDQQTRLVTVTKSTYGCQ